MRKVILAASVVCLSYASAARADEQPAKVYYKDGTRIEMADFDLKMNFQIQPRFSFIDRDDNGRADNGADKVGDTDSFDLRRVRIFFSGNALNKQFSYKIKTDLRADEGGSELKEAWLQFNSETANVRWGQFKVPFSRQENVGTESLEFIDTSAVSDFFAPSYQPGAMVSGPATSGVYYYTGLYNGQSDGEGRNKPGIDNKLAVDAALTFTTADYGSRGVESDLRDDPTTTGFTSGVAAIYSEGEGDPTQSGAKDNFDRFDLNVDAGVRSNGLSAQSELYYSHFEFDSSDNDSDVFGFYLQGGYVIDKKWEVAARFGYLNPDDDSKVDNQEEYNLVLNYFIHGHFLKLQGGMSWVNTSFNADNSGDVTDIRFETQLSGYF